MKSTLIKAIELAIFVANTVNNTANTVPSVVLELLYDARDIVRDSDISD